MTGPVAMCCLSLGMLSVRPVPITSACDRVQDTSKLDPAAEVSDDGGEAANAWKAGTKEAAIKQARSVLGLEHAENVQIDGRIELVANDNTPFLSEQINRRPLWHLAVSDWKLKVKTGGHDAADSMARTFDVYVDPVSGALMKIVSRWPEGVPPIQPMPSAAFAERCMHRSGNERYHGFPESPPSISFLEALTVVDRRGIGDPLQARQILAHYVLQSKMDREVIPVWAITLWGIPPIPASHPGVSVSARNHIRNIVDARTGEWLSAGTSPQPERSEPTEDDKPKTEPTP